MSRIGSRSIWALSITMIIGLTLGWTPGPAQGANSHSGVLRFDAAWWKHVNSQEQQGFIYGYRDCRQPPMAGNASIDNYQKAVSRALATEKVSDPDAVTKAIEHAWMTLKSRDAQGGENYSGPHGYLDGEWWGEFTVSWPSDAATIDRGYLEGYLACRSAPVTVQAVHRYQTAINQHYGTGHHSHDKIADVLQGLIKASLTSSQP